VEPVDPVIASSERSSNLRGDGRPVTQKGLEGVSEASLQFEPDAGNYWRFYSPNEHGHIIAVTAKWLETKRVYLGAAEA